MTAAAVPGRWYVECADYRTEVSSAVNGNALRVLLDQGVCAVPHEVVFADGQLPTGSLLHLDDEVQP